MFVNLRKGSTFQQKVLRLVFENVGLRKIEPAKMILLACLGIGQLWLVDR